MKAIKIKLPLPAVKGICVAAVLTGIFAVVAGDRKSSCRERV